MNLAELVAHVGHENIQVQRVDASCLGARMGRSGKTILQIETPMLTVNDVMGFTEGISPKYHGLILWIDRDKLAEILPHKKIP